MSELNPLLPDELERLATDVRLERHGDPYLAITVLLYPDRHGNVVCVGFEDYPPIDMAANLSFGNKDETRGSASAVLPISELQHAEDALNDLTLAIRMASPNREGTMAEQVDRWMTQSREGRLMRSFERDLAHADFKAKYPATCGFCGHPYTTRGVSRHEKSCSKNPEAEMYGPTGWFDPILNEQGRVIGHHQREVDRRPCARCPDSFHSHPDGGPCQAPTCVCKGFVAWESDVHTTPKEQTQ